MHAVNRRRICNRRLYRYTGETLHIVAALHMGAVAHYGIIYALQTICSQMVCAVNRTWGTSVVSQLKRENSEMSDDVKTIA